MKRRSCGECNACCTALRVDELAKPRGAACEHIAERGCAIYSDRPESCRTFECAWLTGVTSPITAAMRPDRFGVIVWAQLTDAGTTVCVEECIPGALERRDVRLLLRELGHRHPVTIGPGLHTIARRDVMLSPVVTRGMIAAQAERVRANTGKWSAPAESSAAAFARLATLEDA